MSDAADSGAHSVDDGLLAEERDVLVVEVAAGQRDRADARSPLGHDRAALEVVADELDDT